MKQYYIVYLYLSFLYFYYAYGDTAKDKNTYPTDTENNCCQNVPGVPKFEGIKTVSLDERLLPVLCPPAEYKSILFQCSTGQCHCNLTLTTYVLCFEDLECCDVLEKCTDCTFTYNCHDHLHNYCPQHVFPTMQSMSASPNTVNAPFIVFIISLLCLIAATISVYFYKQRRRRLHHNNAAGGKQLFNISVIKYFSKKSCKTG